MPTRQQHRGQHPADAEAFAAKHLPALQSATTDLCWLLSRGYARKAALTLAGDHYQLTTRQRMAVDRCACSDDALARRKKHEVELDALRDSVVVIDGYNLLITVESGLSGGILLRGRDGCLRDLASLHGSYRKVEETQPAIQRIGETLDALGPAHVQWYFDAPVSNSGRLKQRFDACAAEQGWPWTVKLAPNPDRLIAESAGVVISADSWIIDYAERWANVTARVLRGVRDEETILRL